MPTSIRRREIAYRIARTYIDEMDTTSMILVGSAALGNSEEDSDIDIYGTYRAKPTAQDWNRISSILGLDRKAVVKCEDPEALTAALRVEGVPVFVAFAPERYALDIAKGYETEIGTEAEVGIASFAYGIILYDPYGIWRRVKECLVYTEEIQSKVMSTLFEELEKTDSASKLTEISLRLILAKNKLFYGREKDAWYMLEDLIPSAIRASLGRLQTIQSEQFESLKLVLISSLKSFLIKGLS